jgi:hypothetical protein
MLTCIPQDPAGPSTDSGNADGDADFRTALGPVAVDDRLMEAVDTYIPTPDATENPPPSGG